MRIAISQPAYLPWLGYFDLIDQVDTFVMLDNVQFEKQSWQHRNRIKTPTGLQWLTVPVVFRGHFGQKILDVQIREPEFAATHIKGIELNYRRAPFFEQYFSEVAELIRLHCGSRLSVLTQHLIEWFCRVLDMRTKILRASDLGGMGRRSELLISICGLLKANSYLSPLGSAVYLMDDIGAFSAANIEVGFQHYDHPSYRQMFPPFISHASILDLIFTEGPNSLSILRSGRRLSYSPQELVSSAGGAIIE